MVSTAILASLAASIASVAAHGGVIGLGIGNVNYTGWQPFNTPVGQVSAERPYSSFNPITTVTDPTLHCNDDGTSSAGQTSLSIAPGQGLIGYYSQWTHLPGPYTTYMALCPGTTCTGVSSAGLSWFKTSELGLINGTVGNGFWANGILEAQLKWTAPIPAGLKPGPYLVRFETLALHQANAPQFYPECVQVTVTGSGTLFPPASYQVPIPGGWGANDPGVNIDIYSTAAQTETTYIIPGPRVWPGFTGGSTSVPPVTSTSTPPTSVKPTTTSTTSTASGPTATHYQQCGGQGWTGPTVCASPYTCQASSIYYSQCL
ncbi:hypothetical protein FRB94_002608 [Tulasnella sp. JGI-2019a]|nr:hypothetical protein FRB94_002608 [Tulasnella sp. JGI-2019a]KAG9010958.1 hypothetical protein FRB93_003408 [Tulasnella sp. JGI-2019a]KAG9039934.1 hypothetical protein FRB95_004406 [Tulasnella sp. JGI-2019a]